MNNSSLGFEYMSHKLRQGTQLPLRDHDNLTMIASRLSDAGRPPERDERRLITFDPWTNRRA